MASIFNPWDQRMQPQRYGVPPVLLRIQPPAPTLGLSLSVLLAVDGGSFTLAAAPGVGFDFATTLDLTFQLSPAPSLGASMTATIERSVELSSTLVLGIDTAVALTRELSPDVSAAIGLMESVILTTINTGGGIGFESVLGVNGTVVLTLELDLPGPSPALGFNASATITRELDAVAAPSVGVAQAVVIALESDLVTSAALGFDTAVALTREQDFAAAAALGFDTAAALTREFDVAATPAIGLAAAVAMTREFDAAAAPVLGFSAAAALTREFDAAATPAVGVSTAAALTREFDVAAAPAIGLAAAVALSRESDVTAAAALGFTAAAALTRELDLPAAAPALGFTAAAALTRELDVAAAPALGITAAAVLSSELHVAAAPALGATMASTVTLKAPPSVIATNSSSLATAGKTHTVSLPATVAAGDLLVVFFCTPSAAPTTPTGWSTLTRDANSTSVGVQVFYKTAAGTEGGTTLSVSTGNTSTLSVHHSYSIRNWTGTPEKGTAVAATTATPNPPSLTPTFGLANTLWIALEANASAASGTAPTGFSTALNKTVSTTLGMGTSWLQLNASVEDPGTWSITSAVSVAQTYAIQGA